MRHLRAFKPFLLDSSDAGLYLVLIAGDLPGPLILGYLLVLIVIYCNAFIVIDVINDHEAFAAVDDSLSVADGGCSGI